MQKLILLYFPLVSPVSQLFSFLRSSRLVQGLGREKEAQISVADSELQIRGGGGGGRPGLKNNFFSALGASVWSQLVSRKGGAWVRGPLPWISSRLPYYYYV